MEITQHIQLLEVSEKACRQPRNTLKTQLYSGCASETPKGSEVLEEAGDCPKVLADKIHV